jgi:hypothetical protein
MMGFTAEQNSSLARCGLSPIAVPSSLDLDFQAPQPTTEQHTVASFASGLQPPGVVHRQHCLGKADVDRGPASTLQDYTEKGSSTS